MQYMQILIIVNELDLFVLDKGNRVRLDYSKVKYSIDEKELRGIGKRIGDVGVVIENYYGASQDIEGAICQDIIYIVQTRPEI